MTKRDFVFMAEILRAVGDASLSRRFAAELLNTNPRFDMTRFLKACGVEISSAITNKE